jgi:RNA polymerase sigma-70 factor (ECF subfamily)
VDNLLDFSQIGAVGADGSFAEASLLEGLSRAEPVAMREAYRSHHAAVRAFAGRLLGDATAAEDLVHDVFVALPRAARGFRGDSSFESFLIGIAANLARRHLRSSKRRRAMLEKVGIEPTSPPVLPDQTASDHELARRLMRALDELPDKLRIAFVLVQIEERDASEVGAMLRIPASTVRGRVRAARTLLQSCAHFGPRKEHA